MADRWDLQHRATLRIPVEGPVSADDLEDALNHANTAYLWILGYERLLDRSWRMATTLPTVNMEYLVEDPALREYVGLRPPPYPFWYSPADGLVVSRLAFGSAGFGVLRGLAGPLETLRKYRNDRHERGKDERWREAAEQQKVERELEKAEAEIRVLNAEATKTEVEGAADLFELFKEMYGVPEARRLVANELVDAIPALDAIAGDAADESLPELEVETDNDTADR